MPTEDTNAAPSPNSVGEIETASNSPSPRHLLTAGGPEQPTHSMGKPLDFFCPFPVHALPEPVRSYVVEAAAAIGCDESFVALPLLASLVAAIGNTRRIEVKPGWAEPCILWATIVGDSGTQKTPALNKATSILNDKQNELLAENRGQIAEYQKSLLKYDKALHKWKQSGTGDPPEKPQEPIPKRLIVNDTTVEALADRLNHAPRGLLVERDELAGWFGSFDQYRGGKSGDVAHWLSLYNAQPLRIDRKTAQNKPIFIERAAACIAGGIQPDPLRRALGQEHFENGLAARLLLTFPPKRARRWSEASVDPRLVRAMKIVFELLLGLDFRSNPDGSFCPTDLSMTPAAKLVWVAFYNRHGGEQEEMTGKEAALWSKLEGTTPRLALIIHLVREAAGDSTLRDPEQVDEASVIAAVDLADWFGAEGRRIYRCLAESEEQRGTRELVELVATKGGAMTIRELMRCRRRYEHSSEFAEAALDSLVGAGRGRWEEVKSSEVGGRPTRRMVLIGGATDADRTPSELGDLGGCVSVSTSALASSDTDAPPACGTGIADNERAPRQPDQQPSCAM